MNEAIQYLFRIRNERDQAVGAVLLLAHDGVISSSRARELLGMSIAQQREEYERIRLELETEIPAKLLRSFQQEEVRSDG